MSFTGCRFTQRKVQMAKTLESMRQLATGTLLYPQDHRGYLPRGTRARGRGISPGRASRGLRRRGRLLRCGVRWSAGAAAGDQEKSEGRCRSVDLHDCLCVLLYVRVYGVKRGNVGWSHETRVASRERAHDGKPVE